MSKQPLVSVIITTYNRVNKVGRCIDSVLEKVNPFKSFFF